MTTNLSQEYNGTLSVHLFSSKFHSELRTLRTDSHLSPCDLYLEIICMAADLNLCLLSLAFYRECYDKFIMEVRSELKNILRRSSSTILERSEEWKQRTKEKVLRD